MGSDTVDLDFRKTSQPSSNEQNEMVRSVVRVGRLQTGSPEALPLARSKAGR